MRKRNSKQKSEKNYRYSLPPKKNFSKWWRSVLTKTSMISYCSGVKGDYVLLPKCYQLLKNILDKLEKYIYNHGYSKISIPIAISKKLYSESFNFTKLFNTKITFRSTTEPIFMSIAREEIRSYKDFPLKLFHSSYLYRISKRNLPLIQEKTIHMMNEAYSFHEVSGLDLDEALQIRELFETFFSSLRIPYVSLELPSWHNFPGSKRKFGLFSIMPDKKVVKIADIGLFGDLFTKSFNVTFTNRKGKQKYPFQNSYSVSIDRALGILLATYGDDRGLILPPPTSIIQIVIIPIFDKNNLIDESKKLRNLLSSHFEVIVDEYGDTLGMKRYKWELEGVPLRIEVGDVEIKSNKISVTRRDTQKTVLLSKQNLTNNLANLLFEVESNLFEASNRKFRKEIFYSDDIDELKMKKEQYAIISTKWNGLESQGKKMEELLGLKMIGFTRNGNNDFAAFFSRKS